MKVDLSGSIYEQFEKARKRADELSEQGRWAEVGAAYRQCAELMTRYAQYTSDPGIRAKRIEKAQTYADLAAKAVGGKLARPSAIPPVVDGPAASTEDHTGEVEALITKVNVYWDDIAGLEQTKRDIKTAYGISLAQKPAGVNIRAMRNMLFYGPPGTGKTLLAAATSNNLEATFFNVKVSNLLSKYFGESSKLITTLYAVARERAPAVVFLDEIESLVPPRGGGNDSSAERRVISALLVELDGLAQKDDPRFVLTIGATNLPWLIDKAMLSRFEKKIFIPLPDEAAREQIVRLQFEKQGYQSELPARALAARMVGYSGREIERMCREAINHMINRANPDLLDKVDKGGDAVSGYQLRVLPITREEMEAVLSQTAPETSVADLKKFAEWERN